MAKKYIDADRLREGIERLIKAESIEISMALKGGFNIDPCHEYALQLYNGILTYLDTLQEQPGVDLEKGLADYCRRYYNYDYPKQADERIGSSVMPHIIEAARYFYELGQKEMRKRLSNPEYNKEVIERMKSEYPDSKEESK